jgi:hypothetical protein
MEVKPYRDLLKFRKVEVFSGRKEKDSGLQNFTYLELLHFKEVDSVLSFLMFLLHFTVYVNLSFAEFQI